MECTKYDVCFAWFVLVGNNCIELYDILTGPFEQFPFDFAGLMINNLDVLEWIDILSAYDKIGAYCDFSRRLCIINNIEYS